MDRQNENQDQTFVCILDTLRFMPEVLHLSTAHPLDMSAHSTMLSLTVTSQQYHTWRQEQSHHTPSSELTSKQAFNLAQAWLGSTGLDNTDLQFTDNPVVNPFAIVTDHHNSGITKNTHLDQAPNITYQKQPSTTRVLPQTIVAVSKGSTLTLGRKRSLITTDDSVAPASQAAGSISG